MCLTFILFPTGVRLPFGVSETLPGRERIASFHLQALPDHLDLAFGGVGYLSNDCRIRYSRFVHSGQHFIRL